MRQVNRPGCIIHHTLRAQRTALSLGYDCPHPVASHLGPFQYDSRTRHLRYHLQSPVLRLRLASAGWLRLCRVGSRSLCGHSAPLLAAKHQQMAAVLSQAGRGGGVPAGCRPRSTAKVLLTAVVRGVHSRPGQPPLHRSLQVPVAAARGVGHASVLDLEDSQPVQTVPRVGGERQYYSVHHR
eukprot:COSAG02_NODE_19730_length_867_cov_1.095052_1_plen_181_part_10